MPQWALFVTVLVALVKLVPVMRGQNIGEIAGLHEECRNLRAEIHQCETECAARIHRLELELWGEKRQRVAEQIGLIDVILQSVDAPELKTMMKTLERVQSHLLSTDVAAQLRAVIGDSADGELGGRRE